MKERLRSGIERLPGSGHALALVAVAVCFICFNLLINIMFGSLRVDLTEQGLYTLSAGSRQLISEIDSPVYFYFYFSERAVRSQPGLHNYARRVRELLEEYDSLGGDRLRLRVIDPEPFSEEEERAVSYGIQSLTVPQVNSSVYFGLAMVDSLDRQVVMPRFELSGENLLEYELSRHLEQLLHPHKAVLDLLSPHPLQQEDGTEWVMLQQLRTKFELRIHTDGLSEPLADDSDLLMVVYPGGLSVQSLYFVDQYAVRGGKLLVFVDPINEQSQFQGTEASKQIRTLTRQILSSWGLDFNYQELVMEPAWALQIQSSTGAPVRHPAYFSVPAEGMDQEDVITSELDSVNLGTAGHLTWTEDAAGGERHELIATSAEARLIARRTLATYHADSERLYDEIRNLPAGRRVLAARISGPVDSAFDARPAEVSSAVVHVHVAAAPEGGASERVVITDSDLLDDRFWVRQQRLLGRVFATPISDNGNFILNTIDHLSGSAALISVRSRGRFSRPFLVVEALRKSADKRYRERAELLESQLRETEQQLADIQRKAQEGASRIGLNQQRRETLQGFQQQRVQLRRELRKVRHQLDRDIENLGTYLKLINILLAPALMILLLWSGCQLYRVLQRRRWQAS